MGSAMARALARAGRDLVLYNRTREGAARWRPSSARGVAATPAAAAATADVVLTMLADDDAVARGLRRRGRPARRRARRARSSST